MTFSVKEVEQAIIYADGFSPDDTELLDGNARRMEQSASVADPTKTPLPLVKFKDAGINLTNDYLIDDFLDRSAASMLYGDSNVGKTFVALDIACHVATGKPWFGHHVRRGAVIYIATEAGRSIERRVVAWRRHYRVEEAPLWIIPYPTDLRGELDTNRVLDRVKDVRAEAAAAGLKVELIVVDTVSRALAGGNENGPEDMGSYVRHCDKLRIVSGAHVLSVHHSGKDSAKGARGHSLLRAAMDTELEIADGTIKTTKQRDREFAKPVSFGLRVIELGTDNEGRRTTSGVVCPPEPFGLTRKDMDPKEQDAFEILEQIVEAKGETTKRDEVGAAWREWLTAYARHEGVVFKDPAELRKSAVEKALSRVAKNLKAKSWIRKNCRNEYVTIEDIPA